MDKQKTETEVPQRAVPAIRSVKRELELQIADLERKLTVKKHLLKLVEDNPVIEKFVELFRE